MKKIYSDADKTDLPLDSQKVDKSTTTKQKAKINVITSKSTSKKTTKKQTSAPKKDNKKTELRTKLKSDSIDIMDLEKLNEENLKTRGFRGTRNKVVIIVLSVFLAIAIAAVAIYISMTKVDNNCFLKINGDVSANFLVDGKEISEFRVPASVRGGAIIKLNTQVDIDSEGEFIVEFVVDVYQGELMLEGIQLTGINTYMFGLTEDGKTYRTNEAINGNQVINLFTGVSIDRQYENSLNNNNFKMEVNVNFTRV